LIKAPELDAELVEIVDGVIFEMRNNNVGEDGSTLHEKSDNDATQHTRNELQIITRLVHSGQGVDVEHLIAAKCKHLLWGPESGFDILGNTGRTWGGVPEPLWQFSNDP
jgi:hypothetical protein